MVGWSFFQQYFYTYTFILNFVAESDCNDYPNIDNDHVRPIVIQNQEVETLCKSEGWTVIQSRGQFSSFPKDYFSKKTWVDYTAGFGTPGF